jgi:16S rRNA (cytosine967-C5)-methyltransferase
MEYDKGGVFKPSLLKDSLEKYDYLESRDKAFIKRTVEGSLERQIQIDYILDQFSKTPVKKMQPLIRSLLRMGVYQILFMDSVPDSAACNEAVKLAEKHGFSGLKGFVNGVLRNISRNRDKIDYPDLKKDSGSEYLSVYYSMPKWICDMWLERFGLEKTKEMLEFFMKPRPTTIRVKDPASGEDKSSVRTAPKDKRKRKKNARKAAETKAEPDKTGRIARELEKAGAVVTRSPLLPYALELEKTDNIRFLPGFEEGLYTVQDVSSMLVTEIADPKPGDTVADICAAPGGKATHAAERVAESGMVIARDISERKCDLIRENAQRLKLSNITVQVHDARLHDESMRDKADILYMDLPCSGLGIIARKSDIKYNTSEKSLGDVAKLQWEIIKAAWDYVKVGGILIYSTCTVNSEENEEMLKHICEELPFEAVDITDRLPKALTDNTFGAESASRIKEDAAKGYIQLLPGECGTDGFFISKLRRIN